MIIEHFSFRDDQGRGTLMIPASDRISTFEISAVSMADSVGKKCVGEL